MHVSHHDIYSDEWKKIGVFVPGKGVNTQGMIDHFDAQGIGVRVMPDRVELYQLNGR